MDRIEKRVMMYRDPESQQSLVVRAMRHRRVVLSIVLVSGGLLLLSVFAVPHDIKTTGALSWLAHSVTLFAKWCIGAVIAVLILGDAWTWFGTIRTLGFPSIRLCWQMYELTERAAFKAHVPRRARLISFTLLSAVLVVVWGLTRLDLLLWILVCRLVFFVHEPLDNGRPPAVLLLGASHREVIRLHGKIQTAVRGNRVISLLALSKSPASMDVHEWDVFRVPAHSSWEKMVRELEAIAPIVVLDSRIPSEHVAHELMIMLEPVRVHKLVLVVASDRDRLALTQQHPELSSGVVCGPQEALSLLRQMTRSRESLPRRDGPGPA